LTNVSVLQGNIPAGSSEYQPFSPIFKPRLNALVSAHSGQVTIRLAQQKRDFADLIRLLCAYTAAEIPLLLGPGSLVKRIIGPDNGSNEHDNELNAKPEIFMQTRYSVAIAMEDALGGRL
jgi:hypothetical protein